MEKVEEEVEEEGGGSRRGERERTIGGERGRGEL